MKSKINYCTKTSLSLSYALRLKLIMMANYYNCTESKIVSTLLAQAFDPPGYKEMKEDLKAQLEAGKNFNKVAYKQSGNQITNKDL